ncbi:MAG: tetratricopeptide repeat protein [Aggregatilineales bacterium]
MFRRFIAWLGVGRARFIFGLLALTGLLSLMLNAVQPPEAWIPTAQTGLAALFLVGAAIAVITRFDGQERRQILILIAPALGALLIGLFVPQWFTALALVAVGWIAVALIAGRAGVRREYQRAIKHMRKGQYNEAIAILSELIKAEPDQADHRRFRADLYRLAGNLRKARADYEKVTVLTPQSGVGYNGLAEVYLQEGNYSRAFEYGLKAHALEPNHWVAAYNLGMIADRMGKWAEAIEYLKRALTAKIPDSRHRLLTYLWLLRAYAFTDEEEGAYEALAALQSEKRGLREWQIIFESEQAATLRRILSEDVALAEQLAECDQSAALELVRSKRG